MGCEVLRENQLLEVKWTSEGSEDVCFFTAKISGFSPEGQILVSPISSGFNVPNGIFHLSDERLRPFNFCASKKLNSEGPAECEVVSYFGLSLFIFSRPKCGYDTDI